METLGVAAPILPGKLGQWREMVKRATPPLGRAREIDERKGTRPRGFVAAADALRRHREEEELAIYMKKGL
jgi:hypothetical protein